MIDSLRRLATRIDSEWKAAGYRVSAFPAIAARLLEDAQPHREYDLASLAEWTLTSRTFPPACNPFGPMGPPAFTIWSDGRFFANIYAYTTPEVVIHDHDFAGAFINLSGTTIHATYEFADAERIVPAVHVGELAVREVEVVRQGDVRQIDPGRRFIHQVWHVDQPTVVLVIRTGPRSAPTGRQFQYLRAGLATEVFRDDAMSVGAPERFGYTRKMAECLRPSGGGVDYLKTLLQHERPWDAAWHLLGNWRYLRAVGALEDLIRLGVRHQGAWFAGLSDAGSEVDLFNSIQWGSVQSVEDRIALALLLTFQGWRPMREWLELLLPGVAPEDRFVDTLGRLGDEGTIPLQLGAEGRAMLSCILKSDGNRNAWRRQVRESFEIGDRGDWAVANAIERALKEHRLLQPLFNASA
ncbi:MAG TPA: hypothetical protein VFV49_15350 [Thermoanaerobaculia bacterium]|nr:hypothetical protein [Thermoanaerobaculia bacterium]